MVRHFKCFGVLKFDKFVLDVFGFDKFKIDKKGLHAISLIEAFMINSVMVDNSIKTTSNSKYFFLLHIYNCNWLCNCCNYSLNNWLIDLLTIRLGLTFLTVETIPETKCDQKQRLLILSWQSKPILKKALVETLKMFCWESLEKSQKSKLAVSWHCQGLAYLLPIETKSICWDQKRWLLTLSCDQPNTPNINDTTLQSRIRLPWFSSDDCSPKWN